MDEIKKQISHYVDSLVGKGILSEDVTPSEIRDIKRTIQVFVADGVSNAKSKVSEVMSQLYNESFSK